MSWYDAFIPPEYNSIQKAFDGDWEGALEAQTGRLGTYLKKEDEGKAEVRQWYADAIKSLGDLANESKRFQMEGLDKAENYYLPARQRLEALYGPPGAFRK
jgi:hypothetical protein